jgi:leucyl-tRNA synthetase
MVLKDGHVMSKSKGNVVDPDDMMQKFGADALRLYVMFVAPPEKEVDWIDSGLEGSFRFLARVWRIVEPLAAAVSGQRAADFGALGLDEGHRALRRKTHQTIDRATADLYPRVHLNTAVAALHELVNEIYAFADRTGIAPQGRVPEQAPARDDLPAATRAVLAEAFESLVLMLSPFVPHMAEELWEALGHREGIGATGWPSADPAVAAAEAIVVPVQVNGKVRARVTVAPDVSDADLEAAALAEPQVRQYTEGKTVARVVIARGRLVSVVVK